MFRHGGIARPGIELIPVRQRSNAVATGRDLPRIAYLHQALESRRSAVTPAVWAADWATHHARIGDFLTTYTTTDARPRADGCCAAAPG